MNKSQGLWSSNDWDFFDENKIYILIITEIIHADNNRYKANIFISLSHKISDKERGFVAAGLSLIFCHWKISKYVNE